MESQHHFLHNPDAGKQVESGEKELAGIGISESSGMRCLECK